MELGGIKTTFALENPQTISAVAQSIAEKMIAISGGHWTDADTALTMSSNPKGRALKYENGAEVLYMCIVSAKYGTDINGSSSDVSRTSTGLIIFLSDAWDGTNHCPAGNVQRVHIPFAGNYWTVSKGNQDQDGRISDLYLWWEDNLLTFAVRTTTTSDYPLVSIFTLERDADKEYDDTATKFFAFVQTAGPQGTNGFFSYYVSGSIAYNCQYGTPKEWSLPNTTQWNNLKGHLGKYAHPFAAIYPNYDQRISVSRNFNEGEDESGSLAVIPCRATKSEATNRVYYGFPVVFGDSTMIWRSPIKTLKGFFPVAMNRGIIDGDLINVPVTYNGQPVDTWQYLAKSLASPSGPTLDIAIKYAEP